MARNRFESYGQKHVPPKHEALRDAMPAFFDLLGEETQPSVRVVLEHFVFVYIHPYIEPTAQERELSSLRSQPVESLKVVRLE